MWSQRELRYELRFSQLAEFVRTEVETQVKRLGGGWRQFLQLPEQDVPPGSSGQRDFVLERFTSEQVGKLPLRVRVNPGAVRQTCDVSVLYYAPGGFEVPIQTVKPVPPAPLPFPVELQLPPGDYTLLAQAKEHEAIRQPCALYRPQTVEFELKREALSGFLNGTAYLEPFSRDPQNPRGHGIDLPEVLTVRSDDPHAWIVLVDPSREERMGFGQLTVPNPSAGIYRARFMPPEGPSPEQNFEVRHGGPDTFILHALPPRFGPEQMKDLSLLGRRSNARGYISPASGISPVAQLRLASLLGLAAATKSQGAPDRFESLGVPGCQWRTAHAGNPCSGVSGPEPADFPPARPKLNPRPARPLSRSSRDSAMPGGGGVRWIQAHGSSSSRFPTSRRPATRSPCFQAASPFLSSWSILRGGRGAAVPGAAHADTSQGHASSRLSVGPASTSPH